MSKTVGIGHIILWTVVECDLALIAGSLPMLRSLVKGLARGSSKEDDYVQSTELVTIGRKSAKGYKRQNDDTIAVTRNNESQEGITVKQEHFVTHEARSEQDLEPPYQAKTYV